MWESFVGDFIKEIAISKNQWQQFVIGGNSIGGFVGMCSAANDASTGTSSEKVVAGTISGSGGPGTGKCTGAILMNPAGVIQSKETVESVLEAASGNTELLRSVAQITALDALPPCK